MKNLISFAIAFFVILGILIFLYPTGEKKIIKNKEEYIQPIIPVASEPPVILAINQKFKGSWNTTKGKIIDGIMTCDLKTENQSSWSGTFYGTWHGVDFSYDVVWEGPIDNMKGTATVDGVPYQWKGHIKDNHFKGEFQSPRYDGYFDLKKL